MNPSEALSLGSISEIVMPGTSRRVLAEHLELPAAHLHALGRWAGRSGSSTDAARRRRRARARFARDCADRRGCARFALDRHEGADRLPRPDPQGGDRRLPRDGHARVRHAALGEGPHRLPARLSPELRSFRFPRQRAPRARLHRRRPGREAGAHRARSSRSAASTATRTCSPATASWPRTPSSCARSRHAGPQLHRARARTQAAAGAKDEAKKHARSLGNAVTPGMNDATARTLLRKSPDRRRRSRRSRRSTGLDVRLRREAERRSRDRRGGARGVLREAASTSFTIDELGRDARALEAKIWREHPDARFRFKTIGGGGGKGQRIFGDARRRCAAAGPRGARRGRRRPASATTRTCCSSSTSSRRATTRSSCSATASGASRSAAATARCRCTSRSWSRCRSRRRSCSRPIGRRAATGKAREDRCAERPRHARAHGGRGASASARPCRLDSASTFECIVDGDAPLLHGGEHAHPGRAPRLRALLRAALHRTRTTRPSSFDGRLAGRGDGADRAAQAAAAEARARAARAAPRSRRASTPPTARSSRPRAA